VRPEHLTQPTVDPRRCARSRPHTESHAGDWGAYLKHPWIPADRAEESWLSKITDMIHSRDYPNLWTDISFTLFTDDEYVYLLKTLLADPAIRERVLFGSDFYVVENAPLEERRRSIRIRAVLGEDLFKTIAVDNPHAFLQQRPPDGSRASD